MEGIYLACARIHYWAVVNCESVNTDYRRDKSVAQHRHTHNHSRHLSLMTIWATFKTLSEMFDSEKYSTCTAFLSST